MKLGDYIKNYRLAQNLSQRQFAAKCKISNGYISMLEEGKNPRTNEPIVPSLSMLKKIASGMNLAIHDLISAVDDMPISFNDTDEKFVLQEGDSSSMNFSSHEQAVIFAYRNHPEMQGAVDKLLGVEREGADIAEDMGKTIRSGASVRKTTGIK